MMAKPNNEQRKRIYPDAAEVFSCTAPKKRDVISELHFYIDVSLPPPAIEEWLESLTVEEWHAVADYVQCQIEKIIKVLGPVSAALREMGEDFFNLERAITDFNIVSEIAKLKSMEVEQHD